jgi:hypothetical protein
MVLASYERETGLTDVRDAENRKQTKEFLPATAERLRSG